MNAGGTPALPAATADDVDSSRCIVVYVPTLQWRDISPEASPTLYSLSQAAAVGNIAAEPEHLASLFDGQAGITVLSRENLMDAFFADVDPATSVEGWSQGSFGSANLNVAELDVALSRLLGTASADTALILIGTHQPSPTVSRTYSPLSLVMLRSGGAAGYLSSTTTHRTGLVTASDILAWARSQVDGGSGAWGVPEVGVIPSREGVEARNAFLQHNIDICESVHQTKEGMDLLFLALFVLVFFCSLALLILEIDVSPKNVRPLIVACRLLLLLALSYPVATYLMFLIPPQLYPLTDTPAGMVAACLAWTLALLVASLLLGRRTRWAHSLFFLFVLTFATILANQLLSGPLSLTGYLNYEVDKMVRFYGIGNEGCALLFGSWITFAGLLANRFPKARLMPSFKRWGFLLASAAIIAVCALPFIGASFGALAWGTFGVLIAWWLLNERRIRLRHVALGLALSAALALGALFADVSLNPHTHMDTVLASLNEGVWPLVVQLASDVAAFSLTTVVYSPVLTAAFVILFLGLVMLAAVKPGTYKEFWARNRGMRAVYAAGLAVSLVMGVIEDSGIFMPALYLVYLLAGFIWLICDMHTWRAAHVTGTGEHVTLRELLRMSMMLETYRSHTVPQEDGHVGEGPADADGKQAADADGKQAANADGKQPADADGKQAADAAGGRSGGEPEGQDA
jgi:hypothetical protein